MKETYQQAVKDCIGGNLDHGWGIEDSMAVIEALFQEATKEHGMVMTDEHREMVKSVVNPSQARQTFAKIGLLSKETKKEKIEKTFMQF